MLYFILTIGLIVLLAMGIPVGFSLMLTGAIGYMVNIGDIGAWMEMTILPMRMSYSLQNFLLLSISLHSCCKADEWFEYHGKALRFRQHLCRLASRRSWAC